MDKRMMQFKLNSYQQALKRAVEKDDQYAIKTWTDGITTLQREIEESL